MASTLRIAIAVCSANRPQVLRQLLPHLAVQTVDPARILLVVPGPGDLADSPFPHDMPVKPEVHFSQKGLPRQRNVALAQVEGDCDVILFLDDDFVPSRNAVAGLAGAFSAMPEVNGMTGKVLMDGIKGPGLSIEEGAEIVAAWDRVNTTPAGPKVLRRGLLGLYGCNMAFRLSAIRGLRFDERLPLYAWQEDVDFASRIPGEKIATDALVGVHCGTKSGRETNGRKLGYSQMVNPVYLVRKGSMPMPFALRLCCKNLIANHFGVLRPEPWVDRKARLTGNWIGLRDLLSGRAMPERILDLA